MRVPIPAPIAHFIARHAELAAVHQAIRSHRLVTLTGAGGCGKTRLALQAAMEVQAEDPPAFADGAWLVELAAVAVDDDVARAVARTFGWREEVGRALDETLGHELRDRELLLVFDNCEQVLAGVAALAQRLLHAAPRLRILATSREPLGIDGEYTWRVPSMDVATGAALFIERARAVRPGFAPGGETMATIAAIVERLDGLPLAIELAAARTRVMPPSRILDSLGDRFRLLTGGSRQRLPRQQTLEASVAWSYDLLDERERSLARRLSVLHRFDVETAEAVGSGDGIEPYAVLDLLTHLTDKSLVLTEHAAEGDGETRYRLMETVRQFLLARLQQSGEVAAVRERHLQHFLTIAEAAAPHLADGAGPKLVARLQGDLDNLDEAMAWAEATQDAARMLRLTTALALFFELGGQLAHGARWFARALALEDAGDTAATTRRARALWGAAHVAFYSGQYERAATSASDAIALAHRAGDTWAEARALNTLGVLQSLSHPEPARESLGRSIAMGTANGDDWAVADGWKMITVSWYVQHDDVAMQPSMDELRRIGSALQGRFFLAWHQAMAGYFARARGALQEARAAFGRATDHARHVGDPSTGGFVEAWSAALDADLGDVAGARNRLERLLATAARAGSELAIPEALFALGDLLVAQGEDEAAIALVDPHIEPLCAVGIPSWAAQLLVVSAAAERHRGALGRAIAQLDRARALCGPLGHAVLDARIAFERAMVAQASGHAGDAEDLLHAALRRQAARPWLPSVVRTLEALAAIAGAADSHAEATRIAAAADGLRGGMGLAAGTREDDGRRALVAKARAALGAETFDAQWHAAHALQLPEILELVSRARGERKRPVTGWGSLTPTEARVVELVAEGLSNPLIAERMFIARGTVKIHLSHVFAKLNVTTRTQLAAMAVARRTR